MNTLTIGGFEMPLADMSFAPIPSVRVGGMEIDLPQCQTRRQVKIARRLYRRIYEQTALAVAE